MVEEGDWWLVAGRPSQAKACAYKENEWKTENRKQETGDVKPAESTSFLFSEFFVPPYQGGTTGGSRRLQQHGAFPRL